MRKVDPLQQFEIKRRQDVHRRKLAAMRHSIDTRPPPEHRHLYRNAKKEAVLEGGPAPHRLGCPLPFAAHLSPAT